jgi:rod shape-determining protein MreD
MEKERVIGTKNQENLKIQPSEIGFLLIIVSIVELVLQRVLPVGLQPDLFLAVVVYVGWNSFASKGGVTGSIFGLVRDNILGIPLGLNGLSKTLLGFLASYLNRWIASESKLVRPAVLVLLAFLDKMILSGMLALVGQSLPGSIWVYAISEAVVTGAVGEMFFRFYNRIKLPPKNFRRLSS